MGLFICISVRCHDCMGYFQHYFPSTKIDEEPAWSGMGVRFEPDSALIVRIRGGQHGPEYPLDEALSIMTPFFC
jgi:hypothetical protein